jgi:hypothetical protein
LNERLWKKTFQHYIPQPKFVEFQRWPAAGADSETEIGFATKTGATQRNQGETAGRKKLSVTQQLNWRSVPINCE